MGRPVPEVALIEWQLVHCCSLREAQLILYALQSTVAAAAAATSTSPKSGRACVRSYICGINPIALIALIEPQKQNKHHSHTAHASLPPPSMYMIS